jgi:hypothetical protein
MFVTAMIFIRAAQSACGSTEAWLSRPLPEIHPIERLEAEASRACSGATHAGLDDFAGKSPTPVHGVAFNGGGVTVRLQAKHRG